MYVCASCIEEPTLRKVVEDNLTEYECDHCKREGEIPIACDLDVVITYMRGVIEELYSCDQDEYLYDTFDEYELFECIQLSVAKDELRDGLASAFKSNIWHLREEYSLSWGALQMGGWDHFCRTVKHRRRYTFAADKTPSDSDISEAGLWTVPADMLSTISEVIQDNVKAIAQGTRFWRVQVLDDEKELIIPHRFTPPPEQKARLSNRMSPAGVPMFYGASDLETARAEVVEPGSLDGKLIYGIQFETATCLNMLNLLPLRSTPSIFSLSGVEGTSRVAFLGYFRDELTKPIQRDEREHIEYVPTQVFTEYVRYQMTTRSGRPIHGIVYPSSKTGKPSCVIFAEQHQCLDNYDEESNAQLLRVVPETLTRCDDIINRA